MTVQELIDKLNKVEEKNKEVWIEVHDEHGDFVTTDQLNIVYSIDTDELWLSDDINNTREELRITY